jgi:putative membrane protein
VTSVEGKVMPWGEEQSGSGQERGSRRFLQPKRRTPLREVGSEPDPRFTFANERTFLAWNRTALALIAAGLAATQLLKFGLGGTHLVIGLPLIILGAAAAVTSYRRWERNERALRLGEPLPYTSLPKILAAGIGVVAMIATIFVILDVIVR